MHLTRVRLVDVFGAASWPVHPAFSRRAISARASADGVLLEMAVWLRSSLLVMTAGCEGGSWQAVCAICAHLGNDDQEVRKPGGTATVSALSVSGCSWLAGYTAERELAAPFHLSSLKLSDFMFSVFYLLSMNGF